MVRLPDGEINAVERFEGLRITGAERPRPAGKANKMIDILPEKRYNSPEKRE